MEQGLESLFLKQKVTHSDYNGDPKKPSTRNTQTPFRTDQDQKNSQKWNLSTTYETSIIFMILPSDLIRKNRPLSHHTLNLTISD